MCAQVRERGCTKIRHILRELGDSAPEFLLFLHGKAVVSLLQCVAWQEQSHFAPFTLIPSYSSQLAGHSGCHCRFPLVE